MIAKPMVAAGGAGAILLSSIGAANAGPFPSVTATVKDAAPIATTDVHWRGGGAVAAGIGLGLLGAALLAPGFYGYWGPSYYYGPAYYPAYYGPRYRHWHRRHWRHWRHW